MHGGNPIDTPATALHVWQEERLRQAALRERKCRDLIYFLFAKRNYAALNALESEFPLEDHDRLLLEIAAFVETGGDPSALAARAGTDSDVWVHYTLAKALLRQDLRKEAIALASQSIRQHNRDCSVLGLVVKYLTVCGDRGLALQLIESCLRINPQQRDLEVLAHAAAANEAVPLDLYLDPAPKCPAVTYYIPVYNVERYIRAAIEGIASQSYPLHEILVVDDGTPDRAIDIAAEYPVRIVRHGENRGLAAARNTAFRSATTEFVGAFDSDAFPDPGYTKYAMMEFENASPRLAGVGGRLFEVHRTSPADKWRANHLAQDPGELRKYAAVFLYGSNALFRREAVLDVGGFCERHRTNGEDVQLARDLHARGFELAHTPWAIAYHGRVDTLESILRTKWNWLYWNRIGEGIFESPKRVVDQVAGTLAESLNLVAYDYRAGDCDLLYIDFLWLFSDTLMNAAQARKLGNLSAADASVIQETLLDAAQRLDAVFETPLRERIVHDLAHLIQPPASDSTSNAEEWKPLLDQLMGEFVRIYTDFGADICHAVAKA